MFHRLIDFICVPFHVAKVKWSLLTFEYFFSIGAHLLELLIPFSISMIIKYATEANPVQAFLWCGILALVYLTIGVFWRGNYYYYSKNAVYFCTTIYNKLLKKLSMVDDKFTTKISHGKMFNIVISDVVRVPLYLDSLFEVLNSLVEVFVLIFIMIRVDFVLGVILIASGFLYYAYINHNDALYVKYYEKQKKADDAISDIFLETLNGLREVKTLDIENRLKGHYENQRRRYTKEHRKKRIYYVRKNVHSEFIVNMSYLLIYVVVGMMILDQKLGIETLVLFIGYYESLISDFKDMTKHISYTRQYRISIERIKSILNYENQKKVEIGHLDNTEIYGNLSFHKVSFGYRDNILFQNASFRIKPHTINAMVGLSGSGKTTLINLLLRKHKVKSGEILLDGTSIYEYGKDAFLSNITVISQVPFIFQMSIRENLNMVTTNREKQENACRRVGIHDFIMSLPKGYNTVLSENAMNVSGGQKQLLSIARALLTESEILLFDEITSSLDSTNVKNIASLIQDLKKDHTILIVTNKEPIMNLADQILMIKNKKIRSYHTYSEMLRSNPEFQANEEEVLKEAIL